MFPSRRVGDVLTSDPSASIKNIAHRRSIVIQILACHGFAGTT